MPNPAAEALRGADSGRMAGRSQPAEKASHQNLAAIDRFLAGADDQNTLAELRRSIERWMLDTDTGPDLHRALGLGTRRSARRERRDALLRDAAALIPGRLSTKARALVEVARLVEVRRSARWSRSGVPADADPVEALVYAASRLEAIPTTTTMMRFIIDAECRESDESAGSAGIRCE